MNLKEQIQGMIHVVYFWSQMEAVVFIILEIFSVLEARSRGQT